MLLVANVIAIMLVLDATALHHSHNSLVALGKGALSTSEIVEVSSLFSAV